MPNAGRRAACVALSSADGTLTPERYQARVVVEADAVEGPILARLQAYTRGGGQMITSGRLPFRDVAGVQSPVAGSAGLITGMRPVNEWRRERAPKVANLPGVDGDLNRSWARRRGDDVFVFNSTDKAA